MAEKDAMMDVVLNEDGGYGDGGRYGGGEEVVIADEKERQEEEEMSAEYEEIFDRSDFPRECDTCTNVAKHTFVEASKEYYTPNIRKIIDRADAYREKSTLNGRAMSILSFVPELKDSITAYFNGLRTVKFYVTVPYFDGNKARTMGIISSADIKRGVLEDNCSHRYAAIASVHMHILEEAAGFPPQFVQIRYTNPHLIKDSTDTSFALLQTDAVLMQLAGKPTLSSVEDGRPTTADGSGKVVPVSKAGEYNLFTLSPGQESDVSMGLAAHTVGHRCTDYCIGNVTGGASVNCDTTKAILANKIAPVAEERDTASRSLYKQTSADFSVKVFKTAREANESIAPFYIAAAREHTAIPILDTEYGVSFTMTPTVVMPKKERNKSEQSSLCTRLTFALVFNLFD